MMNGSKRKHLAIWAAALVVWLVAVGIGLRVLLQYSNTPGRSAHPPEIWPAAAGVRAAGRKESLVMFAHPECACSRASMGELALVVACCRDRVDATVYFYLPAGDPMHWSDSDLVRNARQIPGVRVVFDWDGAAARRFGVHTSGQTLLYSSQGRLVFDGGITASRGHSGDNEGRDAIVALLRGAAPRNRRTPVFGCALFSSD